MRMAPEYSRLERATYRPYMLEFFRRHQAMLAPEFGELDVLIPRVSIRNKVDFVIQYILRDSSAQKTQGRDHMLCGYLPGDDSTYADRLDPDHVLSDENTGLVVPLFPYDPDLPDLEEWVRATDGWPGVRSLVGDTYAAADSLHDQRIESVEILAYRLGRRCTLGYTLTAGGSSAGTPAVAGVVAKIMRPGACEKALMADQYLRSFAGSAAGPLSGAIPALLGANREKGVLLTERVPGTSLHDLWSETGSVEACRMAGRLLASFHGLPAADGQARSPETEWATLVVRMRLTCTIFPQMHSVWERVSKRLKENQPLASEESALIHGDFYDKQILFAPHRTTLLDYDTLGRGDPATDVGNFQAHAILRQMQDPQAGSRIESGAAAFLSGYRESGAPPHDTLHWWKAAALARLSALYALRPRWRQLALPLLHAAQESLEKAKVQVR